MRRLVLIASSKLPAAANGWHEEIVEIRKQRVVSALEVDVKLRGCATSKDLNTDGCLAP